VAQPAELFQAAFAEAVRLAASRQEGCPGGAPLGLAEVYWVALAPEFGRGRASQQAVLQGSRLAGLFPVECYLAASAPVRAVG